jgi:acyl carrier protein
MNDVNEKKLEALFKKVMNTKEFHDGLSMESLPKWDSLKHVELLTEIEDQFGLDIDMQDIMKMTSVSSIRSVLKKYQK